MSFASCNNFYKLCWTNKFLIFICHNPKLHFLSNLATLNFVPRLIVIWYQLIEQQLITKEKIKIMATIFVYTIRECLRLRLRRNCNFVLLFEWLKIVSSWFSMKIHIIVGLINDGDEGGSRAPTVCDEVKVDMFILVSRTFFSWLWAYEFCWCRWVFGKSKTVFPKYLQSVMKRVMLMYKSLRPQIYFLLHWGTD